MTRIPAFGEASAPPLTQEVELQLAAGSQREPSGVSRQQEGTRQATRRATAAGEQTSLPRSSSTSGTGPSAGPPPPPDLMGSAGSGSGSPDAHGSDAPAMFFCPISHQLLRDPVLLPTGQTYERRYISRWIKGGNLKCPVTGQFMTPPVALVPNVALRQSIEEWCARHMPHLLNVDGQLNTSVDSDAASDDLELGSLGFHTDFPSGRQSTGGHFRQSSISEQYRLESLSHSQLRVRRTRRSSLLPWFLYCMSLVFLLVFLAEIAVNGWKFAPLNINPLIGPGSDTLMKMGAKDTPRIIYEGEWWRIFSSVFLTAGLLHLIGNLSVMWTFGRHLEREMSTWAIFAIFLISAVGGVLMSANLAPDSVTVGASGGVFGLLGAAWTEHFLDWGSYKHHPITILTLVVITAVNLLLGLLPFVDNWCHIGGFVVGVLICLTMLLTRRHANNRRGEMLILVAQVAAGLACLCFFAFFTVGLVMDLRLGASCGWCNYLTCIPTAWWECDNVMTDPDACAVRMYGNSTLELECPDGEEVRVPAPQFVDEENFVRLCKQYCGEYKHIGVIE